MRDLDISNAKQVKKRRSIFRLSSIDQKLNQGRAMKLKPDGIKFSPDTKRVQRCVPQTWRTPRSRLYVVADNNYPKLPDYPTSALFSASDSRYLKQGLNYAKK